MRMFFTYGIKHSAQAVERMAFFSRRGRRFRRDPRPPGAGY